MMKNILKTYESTRSGIKRCWNFSKIDSKTSDVSFSNFNTILRHAITLKLNNAKSNKMDLNERDGTYELDSTNYDTLTTLTKFIELRYGTRLVLIYNCFDEITEYEHFIQASAQIMEINTKDRYFFICLKFDNEEQKKTWNEKFKNLDFFVKNNDIGYMKIYRFKKRLPSDYIYDSNIDFKIGEFF